MSRVKFSTGLFLERAELNRFNKFIQDDGFINYFLNNSTQFGFVKNANDGTFTNGLVSEGTSLTVNINEVNAFDSNGKFIYYPAQIGLSLPTTTDWYWIKVAYLESNAEVGLYSIDTSGNLVCTSGDGELLSILRGQPNFPSRVKLLDSANNLLEYDVLEVINNNNAVLQGDFINESDLRLVVVGTFANGFVADSDDKDIFVYNSCDLSFELETTLNTAPTKTEGEEFYLARVRVYSGSLFIEDKRDEVYQSKDGFDIVDLTKDTNPLFGVEKINYSHLKSTREKNIAQIAWALRTTNWSFNAKLNLVTINSGEGGRYKPTDVSLFTDGDLDGWRVYTDNGKFSIVTSSSKSGGQINLYLNGANLDDYEDTTQQLLVTPNAEEIEIICRTDPSDANELPEIREVFPINLEFARIYLLAYKDPSCLYNIKYRYKNNANYAQEILPLSDALGLYNEEQFDSAGVIIGSPSRTTYAADPDAGFIEITMADDAYSKTIDAIITGDLLGVNTFELDPLNSVTQFYVGTDKKYQHIFPDTSNIDSDIVLSQDLYINLNSTRFDGSALEQGNTFLFHFQEKVQFNGYKIRFVQNYVNSSTYDLLHEINDSVQSFLSDLDFEQDGLYFIFTWDDEGKWIVKSFNENFITYCKDTIDDNWYDIDEDPNDLLTFSAGSFTSGTSYASYRQIGKTIHLTFSFTDIDTASTATLSLAMPNGWQVIGTGGGYYVGTLGVIKSGLSTSAPLFLTLDSSGGTEIVFQNFTISAGSNWSIFGSITFQIT